MARSKWISFRAQQQLERAAKAAAAPATLPLPSSADAKKFGLENALYFCTPFRDLLLQDVDLVPPQSNSPIISLAPNKPATPLVPLRRKPERKPSTSGHELSASTPPQNVINPIPPSPPTLVSALQSLFLNISTNPGDKGTVSPRAFIDKLKELNDIFRSTMHQDAHEFLNYLLNQIVEEIKEERKHAQNGINGDDLSNSIATLGSKIPPTVITASSSNSGTHPQDATLVHKLFEGVLTSETRCLTCETVSSRDECFLDLSIDIEQNSSVTACLRQFSASEMLCQRNKFFCDSCCDLQEAEKRMKIKKLPNVLALHLKRFKFQEDVGKYIKLAYRVAFPFELRLFNTVDDMDDADRLYNLFAIVVHIGNGPHHGHYVSIIKTVGTWLVFDDDNVYPIPESDISKYFGDSNSGSAYVLYYQAVDIDLASLGLRTPDPQLPLEPLTNSISPVQLSPAVQNQYTPTLPPGLNAVSVPDVDIETHPLPPPAIPTPMIPPSQTLPDKPALSLSPVAIPTQSLEATPPPATVSAGSSSPMTPTIFSTKLFNTIRRAPSMTAQRGSIGGPINSVVNDSRKPMAEKSPRPSTSTPSFVGSVDAATQEEVPPLPPLPAGVFNNTQSPIMTPPMSIPIVNEPEKEEKETKSKSPGWFSRKRKSLRIGDKPRPDNSPTREMPSSPARTDESTQSHTSWFWPSNSNSSQAPLRPLRPLENGSAAPSDIIGLHPDSLKLKMSAIPQGKLERDHRLNGYDDHPSGSTSSSPSSTSLLHNTQSLPTESMTRPSTGVSSTSSGHQHEFPPGRKSSVVPSLERPRTSHDRKKNLDLKSLSYSTPSSSPLSSTQTASPYGPSRPPRTSARSQTHRPNISNGHIFANDTEASLKGKARSAEGVDGAQSSSPPTAYTAYDTTRSTPPPTSLASSVGANASSGSTTSASSNLKRATRKLSLTAPMLGFGRRDRDKERDREREREKDRVSPNAPNRF
ncbi:hypothetical protein BDZ97DRAFT_1661022 [Flammula alnicola]|nr:hypothetical protein BDZ97DRAFT_1661022 [Flammula alnicola]